MEILWSVVVGVFVAAGIYLMLERHLLRVLFGLIMLSSAVNMAIFTAGRLTVGEPPLIDANAVVPPIGAANPLPQAFDFNGDCYWVWFIGVHACAVLSSLSRVLNSGY